MIPAEALRLRDLILAAADARGVALEERSLRWEHDHPLLRLRHGSRAVRGCWIGLPGGLGPYRPDVVTVHGSGNRASKTWPRKRDGSFDISAITSHVLALVELEQSREVPAVYVPNGIPATASGLHVVYLATFRLGAVSPNLAPFALVRGIGEEKVRKRIEAHLRRGGLTDRDMRAIGDAAGLFLSTPHRIDFDPLEPIDDMILTALLVGKSSGGKVERRYVLILDRMDTKIDLADPAGEGFTTVTTDRLEKAWKLGAVRGRSWVGTVSARS